MFEQITPSGVVPFREFDGIFMMKRQSTKIRGAEHYGVLVAGEPLRFFRIPRNQPLVIHRDRNMRADWADTTGVWEMIDRVPPDQIRPAVARAMKVLNEPGYDLLTNNCEHTARYITSGEKRSTQVGWYVTAAAVVAGLIWLSNRDNN